MENSLDTAVIKELTGVLSIGEFRDVIDLFLKNGRQLVEKFPGKPVRGRYKINNTVK